jgi:FixJ family two-component response regulator
MCPTALSIAIVDDEEPVRKALCRLLRLAGLTVETFESGQAFLDSLPAQRPDCLVLDLYMPGLNGLQVLERLRAADVTLPTVVITAHDQAQMRAQCIAAGAAACLPKPLSEQQLLEAIAKATGDSKVERA